jgi:hypothetical protein
VLASGAAGPGRRAKPRRGEARRRGAIVRLPTPASGDELPAAEPSPLPEELRGLIDQTFDGDFPAMIARRVIRVGVTFNRTFYFVDQGQPRGLSYEYSSVVRRSTEQEAPERAPESARRAAADAARPSSCLR